MLKKNIWANFQRFIELFTQKIVTKLSKIWVWDPGSEIRNTGSEIRKKPIPDPGSRGQKGTGSRIRIRNTQDPVPMICTFWSGSELDYLPPPPPTLCTKEVHEATDRWVAGWILLLWMVWKMVRASAPGLPSWLLSWRRCVIRGFLSVKGTDSWEGIWLLMTCAVSFMPK